MQQADILEQARLLIGKLQGQVAELEQQLQTERGVCVAAYNLGRQHLASELLAAQSLIPPPPLLPLQPPQAPPTAEPTHPEEKEEDAQME
ncbi:hypothetical protein M3Y94_00038600 [Aphelenchoides besseyi]|nr:hypothetical protein M3Y94_00038600 [Aphelenchoides besseyi]